MHGEGLCGKLGHGIGDVPGRPAAHDRERHGFAYGGPRGRPRLGLGGRERRGLRSAVGGFRGQRSGAVASGEMSASGSTFTASFVPASPDLFEVHVSTRDKSGLITKSSVPFVSYDPSAGSTDGTGWTVPGGSNVRLQRQPARHRRRSQGLVRIHRQIQDVFVGDPGGRPHVLVRQPVQAAEQAALVARRGDADTAYLGGGASIQGHVRRFPIRGRDCRRREHGRSRSLRAMGLRAGHHDRLADALLRVRRCGGTDQHSHLTRRPVDVVARRASLLLVEQAPNGRRCATLIERERDG